MFRQISKRTCMNTSLKAENPGRGRRRTTELDRCRAQGWFRCVVIETHESSPTELERKFRARRRQGAPTAATPVTRIFERYRSGRNCPTEGKNSKGSEGYLSVIGRDYPRTLEFYRSEERRVGKE